MNAIDPRAVPASNTQARSVAHPYSNGQEVPQPEVDVRATRKTGNSKIVRKYHHRRQFSTVIRNRITLYSLMIAAIIMVILGAVLGVAGISHVRDVERQSTSAYFESARAAFSEWSRQDPAPSLKLALYHYLNMQRAESVTTLLGFVNHKQEVFQGDPKGPVANDSQLVGLINQNTGQHATFFTAATKRGSYAIGILPITWGNERGALVVVQDDAALSESAFVFLRIYAGISLLSLVALAGVTWLTTSRMLAPLKRLRDLSRTISETDLTKRLPIDADDDLAELAMSFNGMVDRLQKAFDAQRDLLNDAGHELRTPITVVRGHLELMDVNDVEDVVRTRELALDELSRMHRLAEDLMIVATFDRPDFVTKAGLDIGDLSLELFEHVVVLGERSWDLADIAHCVIEADGQRLFQAWLQLVNNAMKFSDPGSEIVLGSTIDKPTSLCDAQQRPLPTKFVSPYPFPENTHSLYLWVRDHGIGIAPADQERVFERFVRVSHSRPGSGLGLSIVQAIAAAHGGRLEVASQPGVGSVFAIRIPISAAQAAAASEMNDETGIAVDTVEISACGRETPWQNSAPEGRGMLEF